MSDVEQVAESLLEEIDLKGERPPWYVFVVVVEVRIVFYGFEFRDPSVMLGKQVGERGFPAPDVSGYDDVHDAVSVSKAEQPDLCLLLLQR